MRPFQWEANRLGKLQPGVEFAHLNGLIHRLLGHAAISCPFAPSNGDQVWLADFNAAGLLINLIKLCFCVLLHSRCLFWRRNKIGHCFLHVISRQTFRVFCVRIANQRANAGPSGQYVATGHFQANHLLAFSQNEINLFVSGSGRGRHGAFGVGRTGQRNALPLENTELLSLTEKGKIGRKNWPKKSSSKKIHYERQRVLSASFWSCKINAFIDTSLYVLIRFNIFWYVLIRFDKIFRFWKTRKWFFL